MMEGVWVLCGDDVDLCEHMVMMNRKPSVCGKRAFN